ncbi:MAG: hypothetical protein ACJ8G3_14420 [Burkholderiaceae bacterium]
MEILKCQFLNDGGAVGALMRSLDWSNSALGDPASWPISLHVLTRHMLASSFPMFITWGPRLSFIYNDAYARFSFSPQDYTGRNIVDRGINRLKNFRTVVTL